jgi:ParB/RepB/Spo0J family partition protein
VVRIKAARPTSTRREPPKKSATGERRDSSRLFTNATQQCAISAVHIGSRHRRELGDISSLAASIAEIGLLHPIVVTPERKLIAGARRVAACKLLGHETIPTTVIDLDRVVRGEYAENEFRKSFTLSEAVAKNSRRYAAR